MRMMRTLALFLAVALGLALGAATLGTHALGYRTVVIQGPSMEPRIPLGSLSFIRPVPVEQIMVGDVITFTRTPENGGARVTHRVSAIADDQNGRAFTTKGDANPVADAAPVIYASGTGWREFLSVPHAGTAMTALQSGPGRIAFLVIPVLLLLGGALHAIWRSGGSTRP